MAPKAIVDMLIKNIHLTGYETLAACTIQKHAAN
jgi:hypothetical protein